MIGAGFDPVEIDRYQQYFAGKNPWMHMNLAMPAGMVGVSDQALRQTELFKTEFYNDWLRHQGNVVGGPAMMCYRANGRFVAMAAACRERAYEDKVGEARQIFEALAPHMTATIDISVAIADKTVSAAACFDQLTNGAILLRRSGSVARINAVAERYLRNNRLLNLGPTGRLTSPDDAVQAFVTKATAALGRMDYCGLPAPLKLPEHVNDAAIVHAHIFPDVFDADFPSGIWGDPIAGALIVTVPDEPGCKVGIEQLARGFGATPAEARLAVALLDGEALNDCADRFGLSRHTVRNQMRALLHKSGTRNQSDFIRFMLKAGSPFGGAGS